MAAFQRGEGDEARRLLKAAIDGGAPPDEALAVLERLDRLESTAASPASPHARQDPQAGPPRAAATRSRSTLGVAVTMLVVTAALALGGYTALPTIDAMWRSWLAAQTVQPARTARRQLYANSRWRCRAAGKWRWCAPAHWPRAGT